MKITGIEVKKVYCRAKRVTGDANNPYGSDVIEQLILFVYTDEGVTGVTPAPSIAEPFLQPLADALAGRDPRRVRGLWQYMQELTFKQDMSGPTGCAVAALDTAFWDIKARWEGIPLWLELGAAEPRVKAYASAICTPIGDEELRRFYREMAALGIDGGKLKVGHDLERDMRRLRIVQEELDRTGKPVYLMIDSNEYWNPKQAIAIIREMEKEFRLFWVEEPARRWDWQGLKQVGQSVTAAVASGENFKTLHETAPLLLNRAIDIVEVSINTHGITGSLQIADMAHGCEIPVSMMNCGGIHGAHVAAALPRHNMMEFIDNGADCCYTLDARIEDGYILLGDTPGLGITVDMEKLEAHSCPLQNSAKPFSGRWRGAELYPVSFDR